MTTAEFWTGTEPSLPHAPNLLLGPVAQVINAAWSGPISTNALLGQVQRLAALLAFFEDSFARKVPGGLVT